MAMDDPTRGPTQSLSDSPYSRLKDHQKLTEFLHRKSWQVW